VLRRVGDVLLGLGLVVGIGAIIGYQFDIIPTLPPEVLKLVLYKLMFIGGLGLLVVGAFVRRVASQDKHRSEPLVSSIEPRDESWTALPPSRGELERDMLKREQPKVSSKNLE
jgi:hypothetical protein